MGREMEHEQVVDRLIDLQARLRGEPEANGPSSTWKATEAWAAGPAPWGRGDRHADPVTVTHDDVEAKVTPSHARSVSAAPEEPRRDPYEEPHQAVQEETELAPREERLGPPARLATILGQVDELRGDLTRVVEALDAATQELAPDRPSTEQDEGSRDRHQLHQRT